MKNDKKLFAEILLSESNFEDEQDTGFQDLLNELLIRSKKRARFALAMCNRNVSDKEKQDDEVNCRWLNRIALMLGVRVTIDGDPRGYTVKLLTPVTGKYNTWGGKEVGFGVPGS